MIKQQLFKGLLIDLLYMNPHTCFSCQLGRQTRAPKLRVASFWATRFLELVHSNICSPISPASSTGTKYILTFTNDFSRYCWLYFLEKKSDRCTVFKQFYILVDNRHQRCIASCVLMESNFALANSKIFVHLKVLRGRLPSLTLYTRMVSTNEKIGPCLNALGASWSEGFYLVFFGASQLLLLTSSPTKCP